MADSEREEDEALLDAASRAADGRGSDPGTRVDARQRRVLANLARLASLKSAFSQLGALDHDSADADETPLQWGHLAVTGEIGRGGFGVVYRAFDPVLQREVALKLRRDDVAGADASAWIAEARRLARVRHPHVLAVHGADVNDGRAGLWSDLLEGIGLDAELARAGALQRPRLLALGRKLAAALAAIHRAGLAHGDIKAENVILEGGEPTLMDFGAGGELGSSPRYGTRAAMAPELLDGGRSTAASDVYALGLLLLRCGVGHAPSGKAGRGPDLGEFRRRCGRPLQQLLGRMLAKAPGQRPTAEQVDQELARIEALPARRRRLAAGALVLASLAIGLVASLLALERTRAERDRSERIKDLMVRSLQQAVPTRSQGAVSVLEVLDHMENNVDSQLEGLLDAQAEIRVVLGSALSGLGEHERGAALLERGVQDLRRAPRASQRDLAHALVNLAILRRRDNLLDDALAAADEALQLFAGLEATEDNRLGKVRAANLVANIHKQRGRPLTALAALRQTLDVRRAIVGDDDPRLAVEFNNIGAAALTAGRADEALAAYREAARLLEAGERGDSLPMAMVQLGLATTLLQLDSGDAAFASALERSRSLYVRNLGADAAELWRLRELEIRARLLRGEVAVAAADYAELFAADAPRQDLLLPVPLVHGAWAMLETGRPEQAQAWFERASELAAGHDSALPASIAARVGARIARHRQGRAPAVSAASIETALAQLAESEFAARPERKLIERWRDRID